jgi:hypothetical protein
MGFNDDLAQQQFWEAHVRFGSKADIAPWNLDVRFTSKSRHCREQFGCPLSANSGHSAAIDPFSASPDFPTV